MTTTRSIEHVEASIEAARLTIDTSTALLTDRWLGERARSYLEERETELAMLESEVKLLRARERAAA